MPRLDKAQGTTKSFVDVFPVPVQATRAPESTDTHYPLGQLWVRTDTAQAYILCQISSGAATWAISSPGSSDVDTINTLSPAAGNITIDGGTNITDSNAGSTVTLNLDAAITLATSVTSPIYTAAAGMSIEVAAGANDIVMKMGDAAGAQKVSFTDSADAEVASIDSNGGLTTTALTFTGLLTAAASATINTAGTALNLATDNSGDAVNIGTGTTIRAIGIANAGGVAHTVAIGSASAGALTIDSAAGLSIDTATASNFSVSGALADLTLASTAGRVIINGEEAAANAITLLSAAGGIDADCALQMSLISSQAAVVNAVVIQASAADGGIDCDSGTGGTTIDSTGAISVDAAATSNFSVSGAGIDLNLESAAGRVVVNGEEAAANAITLLSAAGGLDTNVVLQMNLDSSQAAADAVRIFASNAAGGIDVDAGTAGITIDTTGAISIDSAAVSNFTVTGAFDFTVSSTLGSMILRSGEAADDAVLIDATNASGGITLQTGGGDITISNTVKEINAEFLFASGTDLTVTQSPIMQSALTTGVAPTGATGDTNLMYLQDGCLMEEFILGAGQTIICPRMTSNAGLNIALDQVDNEGAIYNFGPRATAKHAYVIGTADAFFMEVKFTVADVTGCEPLYIGFRKVEANATDFNTYTDRAFIGLDNVVSPGNVVLNTEIGSAGSVTTNTTDAWADAASHTIKVLVSAAGVVTYTIDGAAPSSTAAYTFTNALTVMPEIFFLNGADVAGDVELESLKIGFQL